MPSIVHSAIPDLSRLTITAVIDILIVAVLIYQFFTIVRGRRAAPILVGLAVVAAAYSIAVYAGLELLRTVLATLAPYTAFALIVMFQSELRRMLARIGRTHLFAAGARLQRRDLTQEILLTVQHLVAHKVGALIVIERDVGLRTFIESGVSLDANVSRDLLLAIFHPGAALHDGAVVIRRDRVAAAGCFLPLTMNPQLAATFGTRHRAAVGITEEADCISIVVSEETARISVATFGELEPNISMERLAERLSSHARRRDPKPAGESLEELPPRDVPDERTAVRDANSV